MKIAPFQYGNGFAVSVRPRALEIGDFNNTQKNDNKVLAEIISERFMGEYRELKVKVIESSTITLLIIHVEVDFQFKLGQSVKIGYRSV